MPDTPAAGWYPDPSGAPQRRYWDGQGWTDHVAEAGPSQPPPPDPAKDLESLRQDGRRAKVAVLVGVPVYALTPILQGQQVRESRRAIRDLERQLQQLETQPSPSPGVQMQRYQPSPVTTFSSALSLPNLVIGVIFIIWFHRAVTIAVRRGRPARRTTGWAVGGWFIPIGNFFLPYQSARDIFRSTDERGRVVGRWWAAYLIAILINLPLGLIAGLNDELATGVAASALAFVVWLFAALQARAFIDAANESLADAS